MAIRNETLTDRQRGILEVIEKSMHDRGYPPSVREIGEAVGLTSPSTVHSHLASLQRMGFLHRDPTKPRAIEVRWDPSSDAAIERRPVRHVPLVGDVASAEATALAAALGDSVEAGRTLLWRGDTETTTNGSAPVGAAARPGTAMPSNASAHTTTTTRALMRRVSRRSSAMMSMADPLASTSRTRVLLPDPDTPVMATITPSGNVIR